MNSPDSISYPGTVQLGFTMLALFMAMFTANLDATILATAIPKITAEFRSLGDIGWYGSSGFLTYAAFQTSWGKAFKYFNIKWTYLASLFIFELGSLICALAPNSVTLIVGRSIAGIGGAGLCTGTFVIIGYSVRPERRPAFMGVMGATYALESFIGPIVCGAFAQSVTWRWCFWINLPIGTLTAVLVVFSFRVPSHAVPADATMKEKLLQLDPSGCALILSAVVCYLLALQWGGLEKLWSDSTVVGTLVGFVLLSGLCAVNEIYMGERSSIVPRLLRKRRIFLNQAIVFFNSGGLFVLIYYIPLYFQSIKNDTPLQSGVHNLPFLVGGVFSMISGVALSDTNRWVPFLVVSAAPSAVGSGLIYTFAPDTPMDRWVGYQILAGSATGFLSRIPIMSNTSAVDMTDMSTISAMTLFFQLIGGSFSVSAAQSVFGNVLLGRIKDTAPGVSSSVVLGVGASELRVVFTPEQLPGILEAYMDGLRGAFALATGLLAVSTPIALMHKWEKLRPEASAMKSMASDEKKKPKEDFESAGARMAAKGSAI